jgi:hypothetical protein
MSNFYPLHFSILSLLSATTLLAQCPAGQWPLEINIIPDNYPGETSWKLFSNDVEIATGNYISDTLCVDTAACLRYEIFDSYGDGICCGYGIGSYTIVLNGNQVATGGQFASTTSHSFNCGPGTICENPLPATLGNNLAPQVNFFYSFIPDSTGMYSISTCGMTACDTKLWVYSNCASIDPNGSSSGAVHYNDDHQNCDLQSDLDALMIAGTTYIIKVGLKNPLNPCLGGIPFSIQYDGALSSVLPIVKLTTLNNTINNDVKVPVKMEIIDHGIGQLNNANDTVYSYEGTIMAEWQGFTAINHPKKNYDFDLVDAQGNDIDTTLLGLPAENDWIFKAEYLDNTLLKNSVAYYFAREMGRYAPRTKHCEVFLDGNYIGVYTLTEKVKRGKERVDIAKMTSADTLGSALTGGYIIEMNINGNPAAWNSAYPPINSATSPHPVEFKYVYPKAVSILPVQGNYIKTYVDSFENALNGVNFTNDSLGYRAWIDVSTFIDFLIVNEFTMNYDSYGRSTYMYKEKDTDGGKLCIGPPWDYDRAMDSPPSSGWVWENCHPLWPFPFWWSKMYTDSVYRHELACRWFSLRENELSNGKFMAFIDSTANLLYQGPAERNYAIWQTLNGVPYSQQVLNLKVFMYQRLTWIDETLAPFGAELPMVQIPQDTTVCVGITYTAPYNPLYSYNWKPGPETPEITLTTPGPYLLEVSDAFGCERKLPMNVGISAPDTTFNHLHVDAQYVFAGNNGSGSQYLWDFGDQTPWGNGVQAAHVYAVPGIYTVQMTVTDTLGCVGKSSQTLQITEGSIQVGIQPNPFQNNPTVVHNLSNDKNFTFQLYDAAGRKLKEYNSPQSPFTIETQGMSQGTYWLKCFFEGETIAQSLIRL